MLTSEAKDKIHECGSRQAHSKMHLIAKIGFDGAENGPVKV